MSVISNKISASSVSLCSMSVAVEFSCLFFFFVLCFQKTYFHPFFKCWFVPVEIQHVFFFFFFNASRQICRRAGRSGEGRGEIWPCSPQLPLTLAASHGWQRLTWKSQQFHWVRRHRHQRGVCSGAVQCRWFATRLWRQTQTQGWN